MLPHTKRYLLLDNNVSLWQQVVFTFSVSTWRSQLQKDTFFPSLVWKNLTVTLPKTFVMNSGYIWITDCTAEWRFRSQALMETPVSLCLWERPLVTVGIHHLRNVWSAILSLGFSRPFFAFQSKASLDISNDLFYVGQALRAAMETCLFISQSDGSCFT